jgi:hypothetical protein
MPFYRFVARTEIRSENLGIRELRHHGAALSFASKIIRDLMRNPAAYRNWSIDIAEDQRAVASVPFATAVTN